MPIESYVDILRIVDVTMLCTITVLFLKNWSRDQNVKIAIFYAICLILYLLNTSETVSKSGFFYVAIIGDLSIPILFWYLSKAIFDDSFKLRKFHIWLYLFTVAFNYIICYPLGDLQTNLWLTFIIDHTSQTISLVFVIFGISEAFRNRSDDLLESRIKFRTMFIYGAGFLNVITIIITISGNVDGNEVYFNLFQLASIGIILMLLFCYLIEFKPGFFFEKQKAKKAVKEADPKVSKALDKLIKEEKIYLQEGLTVRKLSEQISVQEYKVRRYINQHLGFRNFNDFLNSHRIQQACEILLDESKSDLTILEIAYSLGYSSLGPFNKAFKGHTNTTPTNYRKQQ